MSERKRDLPKVTIYNAVSIDGFIAKSDDDTDWVTDADWAVLEKLVEEYDVVIMGRRTYEVRGDDFPYGTGLNVVMTTNAQLLATKRDGVKFTDQSPAWLLSELAAKGHKSCLIIGGGKTNASFLEAGLVDEIIVDIHPIVLGRGVKLFSTEKDLNCELELMESSKPDKGLCLLRYGVKKDGALRS